MKQFLIGLLAGLLLFPALCDMTKLAVNLTDNEIAEAAFSASIMPGYGIHKPFVKNCTKDVSKNGHGWVFVNREYFQCGKIAIVISDLIYGEYTEPQNADLEKQKCEGCTL